MSVRPFIRHAFLSLIPLTLICCNKSSQHSSPAEDSITVVNTINGRYLIKINGNPIHSGTLSKTLNTDLLKPGENTVSYEFDIVPPPSNLSYFYIKYGKTILAEATGDSSHVTGRHEQVVTFDSISELSTDSKFQSLDSAIIRDEVPEKIQDVLAAYTSINTHQLASHLCVSEDLTSEIFREEASWPTSSREVFIASPDEMEIITGTYTVLARLKSECVDKYNHHYIAKITNTNTGEEIFMESITLCKDSQGLRVMTIITQ